MTKGIAEILAEISKLATKKERLEALRKRASPAMIQLLKYTFDPQIKWALPKGKPPYKPNKMLDCEGMFYKEMRRLYLFIEGGNPGLKPLKRETLFIQLLEVLTPEDAELLISCKERKLPYKNLPRGLILEAFPGLWVEPPKPPKQEKPEQRVESEANNVQVEAPSP